MALALEQDPELCTSLRQMILDHVKGGATLMATSSPAADAQDDAGLVAEAGAVVPVEQETEQRQAA